MLADSKDLLVQWSNSVVISKHMPAQTNHNLPVINLIPQDPFMESIVGKFLVWALAIGRYIVIFTELIVILTFLSRFKLDRDLTDLKESIQRQKAIIQSYQDVEKQFIDTQKTINFISSKQENEFVLATLMQLQQVMPIDVKLSNLRIHPDGWNFSGQALSAQGMKMAIDKIIVSNPSSDVQVSSVKLDSKLNAITFDVSVKQKITQDTKNKKITNEEKVAL